MFARNTKKTSSQISNDVANLINEIDQVAGGATAPFDESTLVENNKNNNDDAIIVVAPPQNTFSDTTSLQVSDISQATLEELAFIEESIKDAAWYSSPEKEEEKVIPTTAATDESTAKVVQDVETTVDNPIDNMETIPTESGQKDVEQEQDSKIPAEKVKKDETPTVGDESFMKKVWSFAKSKKTREEPLIKDDDPVATKEVTPEAPQEGTVASPTGQDRDLPSDPTQPNEFNPFVNIGNRLADDDTADDSSQDNDSYKKIMATTGKVLYAIGQVLVICMQGILWGLGVCASSPRLSTMVLVIGTLGVYVKSYLDFSITISVQARESAWNTSMMEDLVPPPIVEEIVVSETDETSSSIKDWTALLQVLLVSMTIGLTGFSIVGMATTTKKKSEEDTVATYCKYEDECSRYSNLTVKELKNALRARTLCTTGNHSHLVDRLVANDNGEEYGKSLCDIDAAVVDRNTTVKVLQEKLRTRGLPVTGLKKDLITKVWIPARVEELKLHNMEELRELLKDNKLACHGKSQNELIRRLIEAGH